MAMRDSSSSDLNKSLAHGLSVQFSYVKVELRRYRGDSAAEDVKIAIALAVAGSAFVAAPGTGTDNA